eukprot:13020760-Alexandrium_andersonii.AAC.1
MSPTKRWPPPGAIDGAPSAKRQSTLDEIAEPIMVDNSPSDVGTSSSSGASMGITQTLREESS